MIKLTTPAIRRFNKENTMGDPNPVAPLPITPLPDDFSILSDTGGSGQPNPPPEPPRPPKPPKPVE